MEDIYKFYAKQALNSIEDQPLNIQLAYLERTGADVKIYDLAGITRKKLSLGKKWKIYIVYSLEKCIDQIQEDDNICIFLMDEYLNGKCLKNEENCNCVICNKDENLVLVHFYK